jgi:hypothetical protein
MLPILQRAGVRGIIGRVSIGTRTDPSFEHNRHRSMFRSWGVGGYHYLDDGEPGDRQADTFIQEIRRTGGAEGLVCACDIEDSRDPRFGNHVSIAQIRAFVGRFHDAWPKHQLLAYSNRDTWHRLGNPDLQALGFSSGWQAYYGAGWNPEPTPADPEAKPPTPAGVPGDQMPTNPPIGFGGEGRIDLWQGGPIKVHGAKHPHLVDALDGDAWYGGTLDDFRAMGTTDRKPADPDRLARIASENAELGRLGAYIAGLAGPGTPATPETRGINDAREEAIAALQRQRVTVPY